MNKPARTFTDHKERLAGPDLLRAMAILLVFIFHYPVAAAFPKWLYPLHEFGWSGVDLFFVLSGYLITQQLFSEAQQTGSISIKSFYIKRIFRIFPAYFFIVAVYFLFPGFHEREALSALWKFLTFTQNLGLDASVYGTFSHAWSLCIEEQFYLTFPFVILLLTFFRSLKKIFIIAALLFVITCLIRLAIWQHYIVPLDDADLEYGRFWVTHIYYPTYTRMDALLTGITVAGLFEIYPLLKEKILNAGNWLLIPAGAVLSAGYLVCRDRLSFEASVFGFSVLAIGYALLLIAALSSKCILSKMKSRIVSSIAVLSFSMYLCHKGVIHLCQKMLFGTNIKADSFLMFLICLAAAIIATCLMRLLIEKPFLTIRDTILIKYGGKQRPQSASADSNRL